jgi:hypothetical protein
VKFTVGGKEVLAKVTQKGTQDVKLGFDNAYMEFEDIDGNKYYAGGTNKDGTVHAGTAREQSKGLLAYSTAGDIINAIQDPSVDSIVNAAISITPLGFPVKAATWVWKKLFG